MMNGEHSGFTIIEVTLFIAISASLLLIAFAFTGSTLRNMRFTDATKSLQSFFQQQYTRVQTNGIALITPTGSVPSCGPSGGITTNTATGVSSTCILLGSVLDIAADGKSITVKPVLGYVGNGTAALESSNPQIWDAVSETYTLQWQAAINNGGKGRSRVASTASEAASNGFGWPRDVNRLLFLKDTLSEKINFYAFAQEKTLAQGFSENATINTNRNVPTLVCIQSDDGGSQRGAIQVNGNGKQQGIGIDAISSSVVSSTQTFFAITGFGGLACG